MMDGGTAEERLVACGVLARGPEGLATTTRWRAAVMRAAARLYGMAGPDQDVRVPMVTALLEMLPDATDEEVTAMMVTLLPVEARESGEVSTLPRAVRDVRPLP